MTTDSGTPKKGRPSLLTPEITELLGTKPDADIAKDFGVSKISVYNWRRKLNISAFWSIDTEQSEISAAYGKLSKSEAGKLGYLKTKSDMEKARQQKVQVAKDNHILLSPKCKHCNTPIEYANRNNIFCDRHCAALFNNTQNKLNKVLKKECRICKCPIANRRTFCDECLSLGYQHTHPNITLDNAKTPQSRKRIILMEVGRVCSICKLTEWMNQPIPIELDHIDGNSENNARENLRLICCNCHALTPTYKKKNNGSGRSFRRARYAAGKSY